jgi:kinesin family protein C2/C3
MASLKDTVARKDEEIERLQLLKSNHNGAKLGMTSPRHAPLSPRLAPLSPRLAPLSPRHAPLSPRRHSIGTPRNSPHNSMRLSGTRSLGVNGKVAYDMDNGSEYSDKHSEAGSHQSMDDFRNKSSSLQLKLAREDVDQNFNDDIDLLGFGDADSEERLSDISDGGLSMGTETDGSISSIVEYTLFPDLEKAAEITPAKDTASNNLPAQSTEK